MYAIVQIVLYLGILLLITKPLGAYMARLFAGERTFLSPVLGPVERGIYRATGVDERQEMRWTTYAVATLLFSLVGILVTYVVLRLQSGLPWNPQGLPNLGEQLSFNTAVSFATNTNWQSYAGEATMSYASQMVGLATHNFTSAATGIAVAIALVRGFSRRSSNEIGNFWVDLTRATLYLLLPVCLVVTLVFVSRGVPQNLDAYTGVTTLSGAAQTIAQGPMASQEAIKMFGTNGGGFLNANSAHPFANPTPLTNLIEMLLIFSIPAALTYTFGRMVGNQRQGWAIFAAMAVLFLAGVAVTTVAEQDGNPILASVGSARAPRWPARPRPAATWRARRPGSGSTRARCSR